MWSTDSWLVSSVVLTLLSAHAVFLHSDPLETQSQQLLHNDPRLRHQRPDVPPPVREGGSCNAAVKEPRAPREGEVTAKSWTLAYFTASPTDTFPRNPSTRKQHEKQQTLIRHDGWNQTSDHLPHWRFELHTSLWWSSGPELAQCHWLPLLQYTTPKQNMGWCRWSSTLLCWFYRCVVDFCHQPLVYNNNNNTSSVLNTVSESDWSILPEIWCVVLFLSAKRISWNAINLKKKKIFFTHLSILLYFCNQVAWAIPSKKQWRVQQGGLGGGHRPPPQPHWLPQVPPWS